MSFEAADGMDISSRGMFLGRVVQERTLHPTKGALVIGCFLVIGALAFALHAGSWVLAMAVVATSAVIAAALLFSGLLVPVKPRRLVWRAMRGRARSTNAAELGGWSHGLLLAEVGDAPLIEPLAFAAGRTVSIAITYPVCRIWLSEPSGLEGGLSYEEFGAYAEGRAAGAAHDEALRAVRARTQASPHLLQVGDEGVWTDLVTLGAEYQFALEGRDWVARVVGVGQPPAFRVEGG
jgi:hypothetical protein